MFTLVDGRNELYQWDLNRQIAVSDPDVTEVHFCNRTDDCSLVVEVKNGIADIPNILLQETWDIRVYAYCKEYTKVEERLKVKARTRPADYVYTETQLVTVRTVLEKAENALEQAQVAVNNSEASLERATKAVTDAEQAITTANEANEIAQTSITVVQESANQAAASAQEANTYAENAKESANEAKTAANEAKEAKEANALNLANYYTKPEVDEAVQGAIDAIPEVDFTPYAKKTEIPTKVSQLSNDKGYLTQHQDLSAYAKKTDIPTVPTKVSELENDKGFLVKVPDGYATEKYVDDAIANAQISGDIDLSNYVTEEELNDALANIDIPDGESGIFFIDEIGGTSNPATDAMIAAVNYYKEHGSVSVYVKPLTQGVGYAPAHFNASDDYTFQITTTPDVYRFGDSNSASMRCLNLNIASTDNGATWTCKRNIVLADLVTETELTNKGYQTAEQVNTAIETAIEGIEIPEADVDLSNYYTKAETEALIPDIPSLEGYATEKYVDDAIAAIDIPEGGGGGKVAVTLTKSSISSENIALLQEMLDYGKAGNAILGKYDITIVDGNPNFSVIRNSVWDKYLYFTAISDGELREYIWTQGDGYLSYNSISQILTNNNWDDYITSGGSDWTITDELYGDNIYNAKEIFIRMKCNNKWISSHFICNPTFGEIIGNTYQQENFAFTTPDGMDSSTPYWCFDGWNLNIYSNGSGDYSDVLVAYKQ